MGVEPSLLCAGGTKIGIRGGLTLLYCWACWPNEHAWDPCKVWQQIEQFLYDQFPLLNSLQICQHCSALPVLYSDLVKIRGMQLPHVSHSSMSMAFRSQGVVSGFLQPELLVIYPPIIPTKAQLHAMNDVRIFQQWTRLLGKSLHENCCVNKES